MTASERKFVAQRKLVNHGEYDPKPIKRKQTKLESNWLISISRFISLTMANTPETFVKGSILFGHLLNKSVAAVQQNLTFVTAMGGKNLLITENSAGEQILESCNTTKLNTSAIVNMTSLLTKLCDGSLLFSVNDSKLNMTKDPSLICINKKFDASCEPIFLTMEQFYLILGGAAVIMSGCCGCYCMFKIYQKCAPPKLEHVPLLMSGEPTPEPKLKNETHNNNSVVVKLCCC